MFLGSRKNGRFTPSPALALALQKEDFSNRVDFSGSDGRVIRYLKGETLDVEDLVPEERGKKKNSWYLVCVDGYPLGWGKLAGGMLKNKYLPGWRMC